MKVLLYSEGLKYISKSGLGRAIKHQIKALELAGVEYTLDPKDDYDVVHINTYGPLSYSLAVKAHKKGKKVVYHAHSTEEDFKNSFLFSNQIAPLFKKWLIKCYCLGDHIITPTPYSKQILESYGIKKPITAISNGIELEFFKKDVKLAREFRKKYNFDKDDKVIMAIGLYIERKGILDFVELARRLPNYKFIWFGFTPLYSVPNNIKTAVQTKLPNLYFPGYVERDIIKGALSGSDLFLFPTHEETEGIVLLEALAMKQNVLIRDIPIYSEWVKNGKHVYKAKNIDDFETKIENIIEGKVNDLKEEGYKIAEAKDLKNIGQELLSVYQEVLKDKTTV
jgi:1,2-diacylglycerol-3-alpha-glucose alpha-1,2-glucosyltransferase